MNSFGLGLVLNFTDNATAGISNATRAFQQMSITADAVSSSVSTSITDIVTASYALDSVGSTLMNTGSSIISLYTDVSQKVIDTGMEMMGYRNQLKALYGETSFEQKMQEIQQYAADSVFEVQGLTQAVVTMKAVGIEAMNAVTSSSGETTQTLMDYASDIAAMFPNMRNAYGTGVNAAMGALKEYIAEGNALSLKRGAGLDITGLLGEDKGESIEERTRQVADLVEMLGIAGYTEKLMGTPTQQLSRMQDILFNTMAKISDSGVFDSYTSLLSRVAEWMDNLTKDTESYDAIVSVLSETLNAVLSPLQSVLDFLIDNTNAIINWIKENPKLTRNILLTVAAVGALLVVGGAFLKLVSSIGMASAGFSFIKTLPVILGKLGLAFLPLISVVGVLYGAWSTNLFGIRDIATSVFDKVSFVFNNLGDILTILSDAFGDNSLSGENFQRANELGILPFISGVLQLKYYWGILVDGFKEGFKAFFEGLSNTLEQLGITDSSFGNLIQSAKDFLSSLVEIGHEDSWKSVGEAFGEITAALMTAVTLVTLLKPIISLVSGIVKVCLVLRNTGLAIQGVFGKLGGIFRSITNVFQGGQGINFFTKMLEVLRAVFSGTIGLKDAMTVVFGTLGTIIGGIVSLVTGAVTAVVAFVKQLKDGFSWLWEIIKWVGIALGVVGAILLGVAALPAVIVGAVIGVVTLLAVLIKQHWNEICAFLSSVGEWINTNVIQPIATFFVNLWEGIVKGVTTVVGAIKTFFSTIASWIYTNVISPVVNFFMTYIYPFIEKTVEIVAKIIEIIVVLVGVLVDWINTNIIQPINNFFTNLWNGIVTGIQNFVEGAKAVINSIVTWIDTNIVQPIATFFSNLWTGIITGVQSFIEGFVAFFQSAIESIKEFFSPLAEFFQEVWDAIVEIFTTIGAVIADAISGAVKGAINAILGGAAGIINGFINAINAAISFINAIPGVSITTLTPLEVPQLAEGGIVDGPTLAEIGEDGKEAVIPLQNNTGWIDEVAEKVAPKLAVQPQLQGGVGSSVKEEHNDYSVTFSAGSIVIQLAKATDAELEKAAEKLMKIIERKQQLKAMAVRA